MSGPTMVIRVMWPYVILLGAFGSFVLWNGGVVLGMLYPIKSEFLHKRYTNAPVLPFWDITDG